MTTLSTHDTKRSEDVRARLSVLAEVPQEWTEALATWRDLAAAHRSPLLDAATEYLVWQTLVGTWSAGGAAPAGPIAADRLLAYLEKAVKEAKTHTTWTEPDTAYEDALRDFATGVLGDDGRDRGGG